MKHRFLLSTILVLLIVGLFIPATFSQIPTFTVTLTNDSISYDGKIYEFDVYILRTGAIPMELSGFALGLTYNVAVLGGGTLTTTWVAGSSDSIIIKAQGQPKFPGPYVSGLIRCAPSLPYTGAGSGAIISSSAPGTKYGRLRLTSSQTSFNTTARFNIAFTFATYPTVISAYVGGVNIVISSSGTYLINLIEPRMDVSISIQSPNGGEIWKVGSNHNITWTSKNITTVSIYYTIDNGLSWTTIVTSTPASLGNYLWTIPTTVSTQCRVRIVWSGPGMPFIDSQPFTIAPTLTITSPIGGEVWEGNTVHNITWTEPNNTSRIKIDFSTDAGSTWINLSTVPPGKRTYNWTVPPFSCNTTQVRVSCADYPQVISQPVQNFTLTTNPAPAIFVTSPNGGNIIEARSNYNITWTASQSIAKIFIAITTDNGTTWNSVANSIPASLGTYCWNVPNMLSLNCKFKLTDSSTATVYDFSDSVFTIKAPSLILNSPNGGVLFEYGSIQNITWIASPVIPNLKIELTTDNGDTWSTITNSVTASLGKFAWTVPNAPSINCKIRITDATDSTVYALSNSNFTIVPAVIQVTNPNGGNVFKIGSIQNITWTASLVISNVKIDLTTYNGTTWNPVANSVSASSGTYSWRVPNIPSVNCKIKISDLSDSNVYDTSSTVFSIKGLVLISPTGGEVWQCSDSKSITWHQAGITNIMIEYSTNNGINWITIINNYSASSGQYSWTVPSIFSTQMLIKVTDINDNTIFDICHTPFLVYQPTIVMHTPVINQNHLSFGSAYILLDMWVFTPAQITIKYYAYESPQTGNLPVFINRISQYYWTMSAPGISFLNGYISVPISSLGGVITPSNLVWLKRTNPGDPWISIGGTVNGGNLVSTVAFTSFSEFAVGTTGNDPLPVELSSFTSVPIARTIQINWETKTEKNSDKFEIERADLIENEYLLWTSIASVKAAVLSNSPKQYSFTDKNLQTGNYQYRLKMIDNDGSFEYSKVLEAEISVPKNFELSQNFPNPFNPQTRINYTLPFDSKVSLEVYNITGVRVSQLVNEEQSAGYYSVDFGSSKLSSGVYFYRMNAVDKATGNNFSAIKKMILLK